VIAVDREVSVAVNGVPEAYELERVEPERVRVTLAGQRRDLYFLRPGGVEVRVDAILVELGRRSFPLTPANVRHPEDLEVRGIQPDRVKVTLRERMSKPPTAEGDAGTQAGAPANDPTRKP
jgi:hypothetical protein